MAFRAVFLGPPGAGKGTQAARLVEDREPLHVSTGDMLREHKANGTELGKRAVEYMDHGKLVPDDLIIAMVEDRLSGGILAQGSWILDGFPRTLPQAEALDQSVGSALTHVIFFRVPQEALVERLSGRWTCSSCGAIWHEKFKPTTERGKCDACGGSLRQREDDRPEAVRKRLEVYTAQTEPLLDYYGEKGILTEVDANRSPEDVYSSLIQELSKE